jgi:antitoxin (DNA-binding transcriptional repressor) of toxin-antitoxin stability system
MQGIPISKFKVTCLAALENVRRTGKTVLVMRFGKPIAEIVPARASSRPKHWVGSLAGTGPINRDIVSPAGEEDDWTLAENHHHG